MSRLEVVGATFVLASGLGFRFSIEPPDLQLGSLVLGYPTGGSPCFLVRCPPPTTILTRLEPSRKEGSARVGASERSSLFLCVPPSAPFASLRDCEALLCPMFGALCLCPTIDAFALACFGSALLRACLRRISTLSIRTHLLSCFGLCSISICLSRTYRSQPVLFMIRGEIMINDYDSFLFGVIII